MTDGRSMVGAEQPSLRSRIAARTPAALRKPVRMVEHYFRRLRDWPHVLREMRGATARDRAILALSACCGPFTALAQLDSYRAPYLLRDLQLLTAAGRFRIRARTDDLFHVLRAREPHVWNAIETTLRKGDSFIDAGANIGFYTLLASDRVGPSGSVIAFEMIPGTAAILRAHLADNGADNVTVVEKALSAADGERVQAHIPAGMFGQASIVIAADHPGAGETVELATVTLDTALAGLGQIRLIKLDLEGAEFLALRGATQSLSRTHAVIFECNSRDRRIFELLEGFGFSIAAIGGNDFFAVRAGG